MSTLALKDRTIQELQQELKRLREERGAAEERARELEDELRRLREEGGAADERVRQLEEERARLEAELERLRSKERVHILAMGDLQDRLDRACAERDDLARKLKLAEERLKDKVSTCSENLQYLTCRT